MQKNKSFLMKIKETPLFQKIWHSIEKGLITLKKDKPTLIILIVSTIIFIFFQAKINLQKASGIFNPGLIVLWQICSWLPITFATSMNWLSFNSQFTSINYRVVKYFTVIESVFTTIAITFVVSLMGIGIAKTTWLVAGGLQTNADLATIQAFCSSPALVQNMPHCQNCKNSVVIYNMKDRNLYGNNTDYEIKVVNRLKGAQYIICIDSSVRTKETCKYDEGGEYILTYEALTIRIFALSTGKQIGVGTSLYGNPPSCPMFVNIKDGVSDFPYLTKVNKKMIYESIKNALEQ